MSESNREAEASRWGRPLRRRSRGMKAPSAAGAAEPAAVGPVDVTALPEGVPTITRAHPAAEPAPLPRPATPRASREPDEVDLQLQELVAHMARGIVDHGEDVQVEILSTGDDASLELRVHPDDLGHVIGKQGRTARSLRLALGAAAARHGRRAGLEIAD